MPINENEFPKPLQKPLKLSAPRKITWNVVSADSIHPGHVYLFDIEKLPHKIFNPDGFSPLTTPPTTTAFHYNSLADTILNWDAVPSEPLVYKTTLLGNIKKHTLGSPAIKADSYHTFFQYGDEQGLPSQSAGVILHTRDGAYWIATLGGLCILHGESLEFLPYNYSVIYFMTEDSLGRIWISTRYNGIFVIDRKAGIQKQFYNFEKVVEVRVASNGFVWITSLKDGVYRISPDQKTYKHLSTKNGLSSNSSIRTMEDHEGRVWISNETTGLDIIDPVTKKIKRIGDELGGKNKKIYNVRETSSGDIYISGGRRGIDIININRETHKYIDSIPGIMDADAFEIKYDEEGNIWNTTDGFGLTILNKNLDSVAHIGIREGLGEGTVYNLEINDQHQKFAATKTGGMSVIPADNRIAHHISINEGLLDNNVWALLSDDKQRIWMGTYAGVNILTPDQKLYVLQVKAPDFSSERVDCILQTGPGKFLLSGPNSGLCLIDESKHTLEKIGRKQGLPSIDTRYLFQDSRGIIWIETNDAGLIEFDPDKRTIRYLNQESGLAFNRVSGMQEISPGKYWIATNGGGLQMLDTKENTLAGYSVKEGLSHDNTVSVFKDSKNRFWVPTEKGLNLLDPVKETNTIFSVSSGMPANGIYSLIEKDGRIYAGTGKGLTVLEETKDTASGSTESTWNLQTYGKSIGFQFLDFNGNTVTSTKAGEFWWGIVPGISIVHESLLKPDTLQKPVGVIGIEILGKAQYFTDPGTIKNVDTLWSDVKDTFYLKGTFDELNTDKQKGITWDSLSSIYLPIGLSLPHDRNYLRFHFGNFLPQDEGVYKYQYILEGVDEKWSPITEQPVTDNYNNLSPGYYTFRVSVRKGLGPWSVASEYKFRIRPPWWFSWWAEVMYFLIFVGLVRFWVSYRSRRLLAENSRLEQKVSERTTELSNSLENLRQAQGQLIQAEKMASLGELTAGIAHEIQNPLNFVNNFSEVNTELLEDVNKALGQNEIPEAKELLKDVEMNMSKITFHGKRADAIVKGMLLHSRASSGQKIPTDVNALADEYLRLSYHGLRAKDKSFNAHFTMDFDENTGQVMLVQQNIGRVLLNLFNNAFYSVTEKKKQSPGEYQPTVSVATKKKKDSIEIRVRDNGQGIPKKVIDKIYQPFFTTKPAGRGTGLGLSLSYDIITKEHSGKIEVVTKENEFTEFIIELPTQAVA